MLDTFFDTMRTNHFDNNDFFFDKPLLSKTVGDRGFDWTEDLPPTFHGSTTSLSQPDLMSHSLSNTGYYKPSGSTHTSQDAQSKSTSAEVLAAASTLIRNGQSSQNNGIFGTSIFPANEMVDGSHRDASSGSSLGGQSVPSYSNIVPALITQQASSRFPQEKAASAVGSSESLFHDMYFGAPNHVRADPNHAPKAVDIQWGSDVSFLDHGYVAPPNQETEEEVTQTLMHKMECLEPQASACTTRPSGPTIIRQRNQTTQAVSDHGTGADSEQSTDDGEAEEQRPRKRRKNNVKHEENGEENRINNGTRSRRGKPAANGKNTRERRSTIDGSLSKRRKSQSGANRENLTEEQKRSNHILSEQKRRNLIKQGFEDLCNLVPELKGGGFSKSAMLMQAADWLEDIVKGNQLLKAQLVTLERMQNI